MLKLLLTACGPGLTFAGMHAIMRRLRWLPASSLRGALLPVFASCWPSGQPYVAGAVADRRCRHSRYATAREMLAGRTGALGLCRVPRAPSTNVQLSWWTLRHCGGRAAMGQLQMIPARSDLRQTWVSKAILAPRRTSWTVAVAMPSTNMYRYGRIGTSATERWRHAPKTPRVC